MKALLVVMAMFEAIPGLGLLGVPIEDSTAVVVGRLAGAALFSLAFACWQARDSERGGAATGIIAAMLFYNEAVASLLVYANIRLDMQSAILWPAIVVHQALAVCCALNLWFTGRKLKQN